MRKKKGQKDRKKKESDREGVRKENLINTWRKIEKRSGSKGHDKERDIKQQRERYRTRERAQKKRKRGRLRETEEER